MVTNRSKLLYFLSKVSPQEPLQYYVRTLNHPVITTLSNNGIDSEDCNNDYYDYDNNYNHNFRVKMWVNNLSRD